MPKTGKPLESNQRRAVEDELYARTRKFASGGGGSSTPLFSVVLRPGDVSGAPNVFTSWAALYAACSAIQGGVRVSVDDSIDPCTIPAGAYAIDGWILDNGASDATLTIEQGATATWRNLWVDGLILASASTATFFTATDQANLYIAGGAFVQSQSAGAIVEASGASAFVFIAADQNTSIGFGETATFRGAGAGAELELFMTGGTVAAHAVAGDGAATVTLNWDSATSMPALTTLPNVTVFYESAPQILQGAEGNNGAAASINILATALGVTREKSGEVQLICVATVVPSGASILTAQFTRDGTAIGPTFTVTNTESAGNVQISGMFFDTLPDDDPHDYNFKVTASAGTLTSTVDTGNMTAVEF